MRVLVCMVFAQVQASKMLLGTGVFDCSISSSKACQMMKYTFKLFRIGKNQSPVTSEVNLVLEELDRQTRHRRSKSRNSTAAFEIPFLHS